MNTNFQNSIQKAVDCKKMLASTTRSARYIGTWLHTGDEMEKMLAWGLVIKMARHNKCLPDAYFARFLLLIKKQIWSQDYIIQKAILEALFAIANRNPELRIKTNQFLGELLTTKF